MELQFDYKNTDESVDIEKFFEEKGGLAFDSESKTEMKVMMKDICDKMQITDEYIIKKLEMMFKYELPFFATNRRLARDWMLENFIF